MILVRREDLIYFPSQSFIHWCSKYLLSSYSGQGYQDEPACDLVRGGDLILSSFVLLCCPLPRAPQTVPGVQWKLNLCWVNTVKRLIPWGEEIRHEYQYLTQSRGVSILHFCYFYDLFIHNSKLILITQYDFCKKKRKQNKTSCPPRNFQTVHPTFISRWTIWLSWRYFNPSSICFV